ncbi:MAG: DEAD/DEAH box helicase [Bacteroidia bacterium]
MNFASLGLCNDILYSLEKLFYIKPTPIQELAIPAILKGNDIIGVAQTGSGKTASYALPTIQLLQTKPISKNRHINTLVIVPTRELAIQVEKVFNTINQHTEQNIRTLAVYGGVSINPQMIKLQGVEILIATPGRLLELVKSNAVFLSSIEVLVLDEADKLLNLGFKEEMDSILKLLPPKRQNILFSATLSTDVNTIIPLLLNNPTRIIIEETKQTLEIINQKAYHVNDDKKGPFLRYLITKNNMNQVLVFTSSVHRADAVTDKLNANGILASAIHSKKSQGARETALKKFKEGSINVLIATDLMSRGIDIPFLPYVINYELPRSPKDYIHRIGRTGRAENPGEAISLVSDEESHHFGVILKKIKKQIELTETKEIDLKGY